MTGTREALLIRNPRHAASKVGALSVHSEEATVLEARQVEPAIAKRGNAAGFESLQGPGNHHTWPICRLGCAFARYERRHGNPARLQDGYAAEHSHRSCKEASPGWVYICHGHTRVMPAPRNQTPVAVRTANATKSSTNSDCTASFLFAAKYFLINT